MGTHNEPNNSIPDLNETLRDEDTRSQSSNSSTRSTRVKTVSVTAVWQRKLLANAKVCKLCKNLHKFPEERNEAQYHLSKVKKHLLECPYKSQKRPASGSASAATPATNPKMDPTESMPKKLYIQPKHNKSAEHNVDNDAFGSASAKNTQRDTLDPKNTAEKSSNEVRIIESTDDNDAMEIQTVNEVTPPRVLEARKQVDLRQYFMNNSPSEEDVANVATKNRFQPLADLPDEQQGTSTTTAPPKSAGKQPAKAATPPPIVIVGNDKGDVTIGLDKVTSGDYWVKYTSNSVILHTKNMPDYEAAIRALNDNRLHYHTYSTNGRKTHAFVLRGMGRNHDAEQILRYLKAYTTVNAMKCFPMKTLGAPLFLVITDTQWNITKLNKEVPRVLRTAVQWENRRSNNPITQCRKCQTWGHSMANCNRTTRCSKCAGNHEVRDCAHQDKPVCANCKGEHRAFSRQCPVYEAKLSQYLEKFPSTKQQKPQYVAAPPPKNPAWSTRRQQAAAPTQGPPTSSVGPAHISASTYTQNFPTTPAQRRRPQAAEQLQQSQPAPATGNADSMSQFHALRGKFDELNQLINLNGMLKALDIYVGMLRSAKTNDDLFMLSREFFCNILPTIKLTP